MSYLFIVLLVLAASRIRTCGRKPCSTEALRDSPGPRSLSLRKVCYGPTLARLAGDKPPLEVAALRMLRNPCRFNFELVPIQKSTTNRLCDMSVCKNARLEWLRSTLLSGVNRGQYLRRVLLRGETARIQETGVERTPHHPPPCFGHPRKLPLCSLRPLLTPGLSLRKSRAGTAAADLAYMCVYVCVYMCIYIYIYI